jgi:hypothetical protein
VQHPHLSAVVAAMILVTASPLIAGCGGSSSDDSIRTVTAERAQPSFWSGIGLGVLDVERSVTVIVPGRKCWEASVESSAGHLGGCGSLRYMFYNEDIGTVRAWKNVRARFPLTLIVEFEGREKVRATTTEPFGKVEVKG